MLFQKPDEKRQNTGKRTFQKEYFKSRTMSVFTPHIKLSNQTPLKRVLYVSGVYLTSHYCHGVTYHGQYSEHIMKGMINQFAHGELSTFTDKGVLCTRIWIILTLAVLGVEWCQIPSSNPRACLIGL